MWWKQNKIQWIAGLVILAALMGTFFMSGNEPEDGPVMDAEGSDSVQIQTEPQSSAGDKAANEQAETNAEAPETETTGTPAAPESAEKEMPEKEETPAVPEEKEEPVQVIDPETGKDVYQTDPVPEGKPVPVEPQDAEIGNEAYTCTISISCATILDHMDICASEKVELVPADGWLLQPVQVTFYEGESVFNVLQRTCKQNKIHMEYMDTPIYNSAYIEGIGNLYEFDVGDLSGWMYSVNDWFPNYGCSRYALQNGDVIRWVYTCDLGADVGGGYASQNR